MTTKKVGILGTGDVGRALATGFSSTGYEVKIGTREPGNPKVSEWVNQLGQDTSMGTFAEAARFGDIVVLATRWSGAENAIRLAGPDSFEGKVVMDVTNPLVFRADGPPTLALGHTDSGGEQVQRWLPRAKVVKVYNTVGHTLMVNPVFPGGPPDMFLCGNDAEAKRIVSKICSDFGWGTIDIGGIEGARLLEPMCLLWVGYGMRTGNWNHAFKLLRG